MIRTATDKPCSSLTQRPWPWPRFPSEPPRLRRKDGRYFLSEGPQSRGPSLVLRDEIRYGQVRHFRGRAYSLIRLPGQSGRLASTLLAAGHGLPSCPFALWCLISAYKLSRRCCTSARSLSPFTRSGLSRLSLLFKAMS